MQDIRQDGYKFRYLQSEKFQDKKQCVSADDKSWVCFLAKNNKLKMKLAFLSIVQIELDWQANRSKWVC